MKVYVDQSGKIEQTDRPTVLAFSDGVCGSVLIPAKVKRNVQVLFRQQGRTRVFIYKIFAAGIFFLLKDQLPKISEIVIDIEYPGKEVLIREMILGYFQKSKSQKVPEINFSKIGRQSKAHDLAWRVFKKKEKANKRLSLEEIKALAIKKRPSDPLLADPRSV